MIGVQSTAKPLITRSNRLLCKASHTLNCMCQVLVSSVHTHVRHSRIYITISTASILVVLSTSPTSVFLIRVCIVIGLQYPWFHPYCCSSVRRITCEGRCRRCMHLRRASLRNHYTSPPCPGVSSLILPAQHSKNSHRSKVVLPISLIRILLRAVAGSQFLASHCRLKLQPSIR